MNRDAHFLRVALENGLITREQASWLHDARQQSLQGPIEQFLLQNQYLNQAQIQHIHTLAASSKGAQNASASHSGSQIRVASGSKAGSGISNSKDSHQSRMKKALAKGSG
ncbi:MAG: hypothetical protein P1V97_00285, partial [Planctomycetota bacterium]|nr:hypothetical protein [Planctomycetota bacterium]